MKVAIVHSYYRSAIPSGENAIVDLSSRLLHDAGHNVQIFERSTDDLIGGAFYRLTSGAKVMTGLGSSPSKELRAFKPDVVHVHNLFPNFGTSWLTEWQRRLVVSVHNFRSVCSNGLLFRGGEVCMDCPKGTSLSAVKHACYRGSRSSTLPLAIRNLGGLRNDALFKNASKVIVLSDAARDLFVGFGAAADRLTVLPNGVPVDAVAPVVRGNGRWLVVGRLSDEKGVLQLLQCWPSWAGLDIVGDGPLRQQVEANAASSVRLLGQISRIELLDRMPSYEGLVFPSLAIEMQPTVVIEAMAAGLPVLALRGNAGADLVTRFGFGYAYGGEEELLEGLDKAAHNRAVLGTAGTRAYAMYYSPEKWLTAVELLYGEVIGQARE